MTPIPPRRLVGAAAVALSLVLAGCATAPRPPATVADRIAAQPELSTLKGLLDRAGLTETLRGTGPFTVFAPHNDAFKAVPAATLQQLGADPAALRAVLNHHVLPRATRAAEVTGGTARTAHGADVALARAGTFVTVEDAVVQQADLTAGNGVVHVVDRVLTPPRR